MVNTEDLNRLFSDIAACHSCPQMDSKKAMRLVEAVNLESDVFIISQTLAANQLRQSGVNFFTEDGHLGSTGGTLEVFLNQFSRTVYPMADIRISNGATIPKCKIGYFPIYNTEVAQCYPGRKLDGGGDRPPTNAELSNCISRGFLISEIDQIQPKLILLMGKSSRDSFFKYILQTPHPVSLSEHIQSIVSSGKIPLFGICNRETYVMPIQHASGANPRFLPMANDNELISLIKGVLK
jgi:uracil-DNA glycosylase